MQNTSPSAVCGALTSPGALPPATVSRPGRQVAEGNRQPAAIRPPLPDRALAGRRVHPLHTAAADTVPDRQALCELLYELAPAPAALGIALGVPPRRLLAALSWCDRNSFQQVGALLRAARLPIPVHELAGRLDRGCVRATQVATQLRSLAQDRKVYWLYSRDQLFFDELVSVLAPLAGDPGWLGAALGVPPARLAQLRVQAAPPDRRLAIRTMVDEDILQRRRSSLPARSCRQWLDVLVRAGVAGEALAWVAQRWQLEVPPGYGSWHGYRQALADTVADALMAGGQQAQETRVPLWQAWVVLRDHIEQPGCALALGQAPDPELFTPQEWHQVGLCALLTHAQSLGEEGQHISGSTLARLVRSRCVPLRFRGRWQCQPPAAPTASRRLHPSDLPCLVFGVAEAGRQALEMAALLGVGGLDNSRQWFGSSAEGRALLTWLRISRRLPGLETGHLVRLFGLFDKRPLLEKLTGTSDAHQPLAPAGSLLADRAMAFSHLAQELSGQPARVQQFISSHQVEQHAGYRVLACSEPWWRLLNAMALDPLLLKAWHRSGDDGGPPQHRANAGPVPVVAVDEETLEKTPAGCPRDYICPISLEYMTDPVGIAEDNGRTNYFSGRQLMRALTELGPVHPLTRRPLLPQDVPAVDQAHLVRINGWRVRHPELEEEGTAFVPPGYQGT